MVENMETVFSDLQQVIAEVEKTLAASAGNVTTQAEEAVTGWRKTLKNAQDHVEKLQRKTHQRFSDAARTATSALHTNPWRSVAIAAAVGLVFGLALSSHHESRD
jgi:ElaB/YqjD/DUF883 family membrane-anchored ribosome-binding protein